MAHRLGCLPANGGVAQIEPSSPRVRCYRLGLCILRTAPGAFGSLCHQLSFRFSAYGWMNQAIPRGVLRSSMVCGGHGTVTFLPGDFLAGGLDTEKDDG